VYNDATLTSTADNTGCEVNAALSGSMLTLLFSDGVGLAGSFGISACFLALAGMLHLKIAREPHTLAQLSHTQAALKSFVPGFTFGSEFVLVIGLWSEARGLAITILLFRLLHAVCAIALIAAIYAPIHIAERLDGVIVGASKLRDDLDRKFSRANTHLVVAMLLLIGCDVMMVPLMPWKQSRFNEASGGFPSMGVLQCCSGVKTLQSLVSAACQIAFLAGSSTLDDPSTGAQAKVIFGLSITGSVVSVVLGVAVVLLQRDLLKDQDVQNHHDHDHEQRQQGWPDQQEQQDQQHQQQEDSRSGRAGDDQVRGGGDHDDDVAAAIEAAETGDDIDMADLYGASSSCAATGDDGEGAGTDGLVDVEMTMEMMDNPLHAAAAVQSL
jgi:hypothetical protein